MSALIVLVGIVLVVMWLRRPRSAARLVVGRGEPSAANDPASPATERRDTWGGDAWEGTFWEATRPRWVNAELHLKYKDGNGQRTERAVDIRQYGQWEGGYLLIGHCHLRNATRTFRTDRITEAVDRTTGEVIPELGTYLDRPYTDSPDRAVDLLLETDLEAIAILLFVAKADGAMRAPERKVIVDTCRALAGDSRITDERIVGLLREFEVPTMSAYQSAVKRMAERPDATRRQILAAAEAIVGTQRTVHPMEAGALSHLREQLVHGQTRE